jgi:hypothetical protein
MIKRLFLAFLVCFLYCFHDQAKAQVQKGNSQLKGHSGIFENLNLAINKDGVISGFYYNARGEDPMFSCAFYFQGIYSESDRKYSIVAYPPESSYPADEMKIDGYINFTIDEGKLSAFIQLKEDPPGCANVEGISFFEEGHKFIETERKDWESILLVYAIYLKKVPLKSTPNSRAKTVDYLVGGDVIAVSRKRGEWLEIDEVLYSNSKKLKKSLKRSWIPALYTKSIAWR